MTNPAPTRPVVRDRAWVDREYDREKYPRILEAVHDALKTGERNLARILGQVGARERGEIVMSMHREVVIDGAEVPVPLLFAVAGISGMITEALAEAARPGTETVVELGAGWGRNLFNLHLSGRISVDTELYALELSQTARMAGELIAKTTPRLRFTPAPFDYHAPDYDVIAPSAAPAVVATIHSAEQIPFLKPDVFLRLLERLPNLSGVHLEPASFQLPVEMRGSRPARSTLAYAEHHDYNRNLWSVLWQLKTEGVIEIDDVVPDITGINPRNPSTLILWHAKRRGR